VKLGDVLCGLVGGGSAQSVGHDLLEIGAEAVMGRVMSLGDTLVLPSHVVFTLPAEELALFESDQLRDTLTRSLQQAVQARVQEQMTRRCRGHGEQITVIGGAGLRVSLVAGAVREADARFSSPDATPPRGRSAPATTGQEGGAGTELDGTGVGSELRLVLRIDGEVVAAAFAAAGAVTVGRDRASGLVVPEEKEKVSRHALVVNRCGTSAVEVEVVNRNGAWVTGLPRAGGMPTARPDLRRRTRVEPGGRRRLTPGEGLDLDRAATVRLTVEGRIP
jgi:hypothetical protein